jgi:beta-phosphoglucomutase
MIKGVLFDMDGVLVDSEPFICKAAIIMFAELGVKASPDDFHPFVGMGENKYIGGVAAKHGLMVDIEKVKARTYEIYKTIVIGKIKALPGAHEFISRCQKKGLKLALATSADIIKMEVNLRETGLSGNTFKAIITGEDVQNKKPFPDVFLKAASGIGLKPSECLVIEDAINGIKAGKSAGCRCLAVTTSFKASELNEADWICDSLLDVPEEVINW